MSDHRYKISLIGTIPAWGNRGHGFSNAHVLAGTSPGPSAPGRALNQHAESPCHGKPQPLASQDQEDCVTMEVRYKKSLAVHLLHEPKNVE